MLEASALFCNLQKLNAIIRRILHRFYISSYVNLTEALHIGDSEMVETTM
jgi:hypothetical protein